ncbi:MAG: hypothetical protein L6367_16000 [Cellulomonas sp.]|nr:hypothetical protein [Cellulomonas sp.]
MASSGARRIGVVAAASWLLAAGLTGTVAWSAVAVIDDGAPRAGVLTEAEVAATLASARATAASATPGPTTSTPTPTAPSATPSQTPSPSQAPTSSAPSTPPPDPTTDPAPAPPTAVAATWSVTGGTVAAACTASAISLLYATPQDGWTIEVGSTGPEHLEIELTRGEQETKVRAVCIDGSPVQTTEAGSEESED